jgi:hypothetical protein
LLPVAQAVRAFGGAPVRGPEVAVEAVAGEAGAGLGGRDDRFFPVEFQRRVVRERLGISPDEMAGGHLVALSRPKELADRLKAYREGIAGEEDG